MDYLSINKDNWNKRLAFHIDSDFYNLEAFLLQPDVLNSVETDLLGDINGKTLLHLQCHFGMDTLSLAGRGAICTGIDLSDAAINKANELVQQTGLKARFIESDVYALPERLNEKFDRVFTSYGTIGWLPDIRRWASVVAHYMKPGSEFVMVDFHPFMWTFDDGLGQITYDYFNADAIIEKNQGSYANPDHEELIESVGWNHGMAEIISALMEQGLVLKHFSEHDYSPYQLGKNWVSPNNDGKYRPASLQHKVPLLYALKFVKP